MSLRMEGVVSQRACCLFRRGSLAVKAACPDSHPRVPVQQQRCLQIRFVINTVLLHPSQITNAVLPVGHKASEDSLYCMLIKKRRQAVDYFLFLALVLHYNENMCHLVKMHFLS